MDVTALDVIGKSGELGRRTVKFDAEFCWDVRLVKVTWAKNGSAICGGCTSLPAAHGNSKWTP